MEQISGQTDGMTNAIVDAKTGRILGCSLLCREAGEVISDGADGDASSDAAHRSARWSFASSHDDRRIKYAVFRRCKQQVQYHRTYSK